jgi:GNAT superfamily N-acetyltransferase
MTMEIVSAVQVVGTSLVALQSIKQAVRFEKIDSICWFHTPKHADALLTTDLTPLQVIEAAKAANITGKIVIHPFLLPGLETTDLVQRYAQQGFVLDTVQHLMRLELTPETDLLSDWRVYPAETMQQVQQISSSAKQVLLNQKNLPPQPLGVRLYAVQDSSQVIAWGRVSQVQAHSAWLSDLFTKPKFRQRGVMTALMRHAQAEALAFGAQEMLLFSEAKNHDFYVRLGFEVIAVKLRFTYRRGFLGWLVGVARQGFGMLATN